MGRTPYSVRRRVHEIVRTSRKGDRASQWFGWGIMTLILLNVAALLLESEATIAERYGTWLQNFELFSVLVFSVEFGLRLWSCVEDPRFHGAVAGRLRWLRSPLAIVDLLAVLPFYLAFLKLDLRMLRALRLFRIFRLLHARRFAESMKTLQRVARSRREELVISLSAILVLLLLGSSMMHLVEPETFPSIPKAMWWGVATLSTVGYGDVYPKTGPGQMVGALVALLGIAVFALPAGILGGAFVEDIQKQRKPKAPRACPHCGKNL